MDWRDYGRLCRRPLFSKAYTAESRKKILTIAGLLCLGLLVLLRGFNLYGETADWAMQSSVIKTIMDFLNYTKYPPSLDFLLFALGIGTLLLAWLETAKHAWLEKVNVLGSAPMFFYILHLYALLIFYAIAIAIFGPNVSYGSTGETNYLGFRHIGYVWLFSAFLVTLLYWPCKKFGQFKRKTSMRWVKYF